MVSLLKLAPGTDLEALRERLGLLGRDAKRHFEPLGNVHFARWVVIAVVLYAATMMLRSLKAAPATAALEAEPAA